MINYKSPQIHRTPLYRAKASYSGMKARCLNVNGKDVEKLKLLKMIFTTIGVGQMAYAIGVKNVCVGNSMVEGLPFKQVAVGSTPTLRTSYNGRLAERIYASHF